MFRRTTPGDRSAPEHDPLHLRIATAVMVLGLIAGGVAVVWRDMSARNGLLLTGASDRVTAPSQDPMKLPPVTLTPAESGNAGLRLLSAAATACRRVSYQGVQLTEWHGPGGSWTSVLNVWHQRGRQTLVQAAAVPADQAAQPLRAAYTADPDGAADADQRGPDSVISVTPQMVALLAANYRVALGSQGWIAGRPAQEVVLYRRRSAVVAARFWLDRGTKLPLRRETFDTRARLVTEDTFVSLQLGALAGAELPATRSMPSSTPLASPQLLRLRAAGWPLPGRLPGNLTLVQAGQTGTPGGRVVDLAYSDGLSVISLFLQRGHLPSAMSGWQAVTVRGQLVYTADPDQRSVAWSARGFVYTLIADAPAQTVDEAVTALPHGGKPGFFGRMDRGLRRLASWLNPFR
ncbi:MAG TPA: sigma-E factor regulatory protein RseB domain-containing protein [Streptosporangiaceae bacterium]|nr:sigma-E factor regulatory protein RseB domain-containing protein [Streptosporangiaceae bacterium]